MRRLLGFFIFTIMIIAIVLVYSPSRLSTYSIEDNIIPQANTTNDTLSSNSAPTNSGSNEDYDKDFSVLISDAENGVVSVLIDIDTNKTLKLKSSLGDDKIYYDIESNEETKIPLQMGDGIYEISIFINKSGSDYIKLYSEEVKMDASDSNVAFLNSNHVVDFEDSANMKEIASELVNGNTSTEVVNEVYEFVVNNFEYDYDKAETLSSDYIPNIDDVLQAKKGICYDYAAVTASILRSAGIPTKLTMGYRSDTDVYHAWNEVFIDGEWVIIDTTWDSVQLSNGERVSMVKDSALYSAEQQF